MDEILSHKPNKKLQNIDSDIKNYVELLEKKLKHFFIWECFNKENEMKYLDLQEETYSLRSQINECKKINDLQREHIQKIENENTCLKSQMLRRENGKFKLSNLNTNKTLSASVSNITDKRFLQSNDAIDDNIDTAANCVLIKGFTELQLQENRKKNIINLGRHMNIKLTNKDIVNISTKESKYNNRNNLKSNIILLIVQFQDPEMKVNFLKNKEKLKQYQHLTEIEIKDYVSDEVYDLYQYAKILKSDGYNYIYWRNNRVYVKKTQSSLCEPILIKSPKDVDNLKSMKKK